MLELEPKLVSFLSYIFNVKILNIIIVSLLLNSCYVHFIIVAILIYSYHVPHMYCLLYFHYFHSLPSSNMVLLRTGMWLSPKIPERCMSCGLIILKTWNGKMRVLIETYLIEIFYVATVVVATMVAHIMTRLGILTLFWYLLMPYEKDVETGGGLLWYKHVLSMRRSDELSLRVHHQNRSEGISWRIDDLLYR